MNNIKNNVRLIGNAGQEPKMKVLENGKKTTRFSLATNTSYKNQKGEKVTQTDWHNMVAWGAKAELIEQYVTKGSHIAIEGKLTSRSYENDQNIKCYITEIIIGEVLLLDTNPNGKVA